MSDDFHEIRFPEDISLGAQGGPTYDTDITVTKAGYEQRNLARDEGLCTYNVTHGVKKRQQYDKLLAFYRARKGKTYGFRYKDWTDFKVQNQIIGTGDGTTTVFQLIKTYQDAAGEDIRIIKKPVANTVWVYVNGAYQASGVTCDTTTGIVTFSVAPPNNAIISADFQFDVPVRFDTDMSGAAYNNYDNFEWDNIMLTEILI